MATAIDLERELHLELKGRPHATVVGTVHLPRISVASIFNQDIMRIGPETHIIISPIAGIDPEDIAGLEQFRKGLIGNIRPSFQRPFIRNYVGDVKVSAFPERIILGSTTYRVFDPSQGNLEEQIRDGVRIAMYEDYKIKPDSLPQEVGHYIRVRLYPNLAIARIVFENERNYPAHYDDRLRFFITRGQVEIIKQLKNPYLV